MTVEAVAIKSHASYQEQVQKLRDSNLEIEDSSEAESYLRKVNYYRLSGYMRFFKDQQTGKFVSGSKIDDIYRLYEFDRRLRKLVIEQLEVVEVLFRSRISYELAESYGPIAYLDPVNFSNHQFHSDFLINFEKEMQRSSKVTFVAHHHSCYGGLLPIWVAVEVMSFGTLSKLYSNMLPANQKEIAKAFGVPSVYIVSWLRHFCLIRNVCAHYSRVYGRTFPSGPKIYKKDTAHYFTNPKHQQRTFFGAMYALKKLFQKDAQWRGFLTELEALLEEYEDVVVLGELGFDSDWSSIMR